MGCFDSCDQHPCKFTEEFVCLRKEANSQRTALENQHGRRFIVLEHQYGRRDVMWKRSCNRPRDVVVDYLTLSTRFKVCTRKEENVLPKYPKITQKSLRIVSSHDFNSSNHPIELNENDPRVLNGIIQIQESRAKQSLRYCPDQNYKEEHTSKD